MSGPPHETAAGRCQDCGKRDKFRVNHPSGALCYTCVRERILSEAASEARPTTEEGAGLGRLVHLMECLSCHRFGTPISPDEKVCGNCGNSADTRMWFRELGEKKR